MGINKGTTSMCHLIAMAFLLVTVTSQRIAIIGGGVSGTFVSKYITDLDNNCGLDSITLFDPFPVGAFTEKGSSRSQQGQGQRIATLRLDDDRTVELGAAGFSDFSFHVKQIASSGNLTLVPLQTTRVEKDGVRSVGLAISTGKRNMVVNTANKADAEQLNAFWWRYTRDWLRLSRAAEEAILSLRELFARTSARQKHFFQSPDEIWGEVGFDYMAHSSLADLCNQLWISNDLPWWRRLPWLAQGSLRQELLSALSILNLNQENTQVNGLSGLFSFATLLSGSFSILGGNVQLVASAWEQAQTQHALHCPHKAGTITQTLSRVATVVGSLEGFELYSEDSSYLGNFDLVVLASPFSTAGVDFLVKSHTDDSVLLPMSLGGMVNNLDDTSIPDDHFGHIQLPKRLPPAVTRPFTKVVTTIVRNGALQREYFGLEGEQIPQSILVTPIGKLNTHNITGISELSERAGLYRVLSSQTLDLTTVQQMFGASASIEYVKQWGGRSGGASPDFQGSGISPNFLLYDAATGFHGHTSAGALYFPNAIEYTLASVEANAIGARAVAKLIAKRLDWVKDEMGDYSMGDEL